MNYKEVPKFGSLVKTAKDKKDDLMHLPTWAELCRWLSAQL